MSDDDCIQHLDAIRGLYSVLVEKLKYKDQFINNLTEELLHSKREIYELRKEIDNLVCNYEDKLSCQIQHQKMQEEVVAMCCNEDYNEFRMCKVRPIDRNGNMKK